MRRLAIVLLGIILLSPACFALQLPAEWRDQLVDQLAGKWKLEGTVMGKAAHHEVTADWVLNTQFLRLHEKTSPTAPKGEQPYEAYWFLGYDSVSERYVLHLMDVFGARSSETLGYGVRDGDEIRFTFEYPDGPFHTVFEWQPESGSWRWTMEQKNKAGKWAPFADLKLTRMVYP